MRRKIAAILVAHIADYCRLVADDEEETLRRMASCRSTIDDFIAIAGGRIFNTAGRFQVSLPTPLAPIAAFIAPEDQARIEPLYEAAMMRELATLFDAIPHDQLAVQWDTNFEFAMLDEVMPHWFGDPRASIVERLVRLGRTVPAGVNLGYHFCHGHERHHRERPYSAQPLVEIANALALSLGRPLDWIHLPVEGDSVDLRFFETLGQLSLRPETRLYLGLLHLSDGAVGAKARIVAAQRFIHDFGVATDCGWGRHRMQDVDALVATSESPA